MQKLINLMAVSSFVVSGVVVFSGFYLYSNRETLIKSVKENITKELIPTSIPTDVNNIKPIDTNSSPIPSPF